MEKRRASQRAYYDRHLKREPIKSCCSECENGFEGIAGQKYCSRRCNGKAQARKKKAKPRICRQCGGAFFDRGLICSDECREIRAREYKRRRKKFKTRQLRASLRERQGGKCAICGTRIGKSTHIDHIVPVSRGGSDARYNLQLTHPDCNLRKLAKDPLDFARELGRLL